jgi:uncharacterized Ntn-hydrolase superfamily protein
MRKIVNVIITIDLLVKLMTDKFPDEIEDLDVHWDIINPLIMTKEDLLSYIENTYDYHTVNNFLMQEGMYSMVNFLKFRNLMENTKTSMYEKIDFKSTYDLLYHIKDLKSIYDNNEDFLE